MSDIKVQAEVRAESKYSSRKFLLAVAVILIGTAMAGFERLTGDQLIDLLKWVSGMYFGFNVTQKVSEKASEWLAKKAT